MTKLSPEQRGYGQAHRARRRGIAPMVEAGIVRCARCGELIRPGEPWDLGHVDGTERMVHSGPEHRRCNRATELRGNHLLAMLENTRSACRHSHSWSGRRAPLALLPLRVIVSEHATSPGLLDRQYAIPSEASGSSSDAPRRPAFRPLAGRRFSRRLIWKEQRAGAPQALARCLSSSA
jgi:hypothetical protein